jgi:hypothetical protein
MQNDNLVEEIEYNGYKIKIVLDDFSGEENNPRNWDNLGTMLCFHNRYDLGDKNPYKKWNDMDETLKDIRETEGKCIALPLYLYDHSGLSMSTRDYKLNGDMVSQWDSGWVGIIYASYNKIRKEYSCKYVTKKVQDKVIELLKSEVKTYDSYLRGECYGYVVEDENENVLDSCWGFIGELDYCILCAKDSVDYIAKNNIGNGAGI